MKETVKINLGGILFHIDEDAYRILHKYIEGLKMYFSKEPESAKEIIDDIEMRIAELLEEKLNSNKEVIGIEDINDVISRLGKIEDFELEEEAPEGDPVNEQTNERREHRKLYRDIDHSYIGGVAAGLAAYFNTDPIWIRVAFFALFFANGFGLILYIILWVVVPSAQTTAQRLQMQGKPVNVSNIEKNFQAEYHRVKNNLGRVRESKEYERTRGIFQDIIYAIGSVIKVLFKIVVYALGIAFLIAGIFILFGFVSVLFFRDHVFDWFHYGPHIYIPPFHEIFPSAVSINLVTIAIFILILIPVIALIYGGIRLLLNIKSHSPALRATALTAWVLALVLLIATLFLSNNNFTFRAQNSTDYPINTNDVPVLYLNMNNDDPQFQHLNVFSIFNYNFLFSRDDESMFGQPQLVITPSTDDSVRLIVKKYVRNITPVDADRFLDKIYYSWAVKDSMIEFDPYFSIDKRYKWHLPEMELDLEIPENKVIFISRDLQPVLKKSSFEDQDNTDLWQSKKWIMKSEGLEPYRQ